MEGATKSTRTSWIRFAFGLFGIYFDRSPAGIRAETSWGGEMVAPRRGRIFACLKLFHIAASLQNIFGFMRQHAYLHWRVVVPITHLSCSWESILRHSQTFDANR